MAGHLQRTATCLFFLSLFKLKRSETSPRCELFNPRVVVPPPPTRPLGPLNSEGGFCATVKTIKKKNQSWETWSLFTWMCFVCCAVVNTRSQLVHFIFQGQATLSPLSFYSAPCPSPTCAFSCRAL